MLSTSAASPASPVVSSDQLLEVTTLANLLLPPIRPKTGSSESPLAALGIDAAAPGALSSGAASAAAAVAATAIATAAAAGGAEGGSGGGAGGSGSVSRRRGAATAAGIAAASSGGEAPTLTASADAAAAAATRAKAKEAAEAKTAAEAAAAAAAGLALERVLEAEADLLRGYGANLVAPLMQVVGASVGPAVKLQCLAALGKFLHHAPGAMLSTGDAALHPGQTASFLAGLLASRDPAVLTVALFLVEMLMHKLPDTFSRAFRKEGAVHAIEQLCAQRVEGAAAAAPVGDGGGGASSGGTGGNLTPRDQVVSSGLGGGGGAGSGSAASIVARLALSGSKKTVDTPQRRAALERAAAVRTAYFSGATAAGQQAVDGLLAACAPVRCAGPDPAVAAAVAVKFLAALDEAGRSLRTNPQPTLCLLLLLRASSSAHLDEHSHSG